MDDVDLEDLYEKDAIDPSDVATLAKTSPLTKAAVTAMGLESSSGLQISNVQSLPATMNLFKRAASSTSSSSCASSETSETESIKHRRKSTHVARSAMIEFQNDRPPTETANGSLDDILLAAMERSSTAQNAHQPSEMLIRIGNVKKMANPNIDLINKASFLKISLDFMLEELGMVPLQLSDYCTFGDMKTQYARNKIQMRNKS